MAGGTLSDAQNEIDKVKMKLGAIVTANKR
jgi:hypothetical protein